MQDAVLGCIRFHDGFGDFGEFTVPSLVNCVCCGSIGGMFSFYPSMSTCVCPYSGDLHIFMYISLYICIIMIYTVIYTCDTHIHIYIHIHIYMRILYQSVKHILAVSLFIRLLFLSKIASQSGGDPTEQPRRPQSLQRFKRTVPQRTSWVLVDLPHFAKRGRSVYCEQFAQQISTNHSFWHEDVCIMCVSGVSGVSMHQTHLAV